MCGRVYATNEHCHLVLDVPHSLRIKSHSRVFHCAFNVIDKLVPEKLVFIIIQRGIINKNTSITALIGIQDVLAWCVCVCVCGAYAYVH